MCFAINDICTNVPQRCLTVIKAEGKTQKDKSSTITKHDTTITKIKVRNPWLTISKFSKGTFL
jgi:hypothetical protein